MEELRFEILNINNETDIIEYEKLLFDAFIKRAPHGWVYNNYKKIDNLRLQPCFFYNDLLILIVKRSNKIIISNTLNLNIKNKMQLVYIGFDRSKINENEKYCEGLVFCTTTDAVDPNFVDAFKKVGAFFNSESLKQGFNVIYGTCGTHLIRFYKRLGFETIDEIDTEYGREVLIKKTIL